jgi:glycosyltransferase involved in cell wall biosynthesis
MIAEMPFRVLQVITDPTRRGAQLFAVDLGDALGHAGIEVRTVALGDAQGPLTLDVPPLGRRRIAWSTLASLRRELARADIAVAHGGQTLPACALATLAKPTPFVYRQISDSLFWASTAARRVRVRLGLARAAHVVALWEGAAATLHTNFAVPRDRITVIPNGVVADRFVPATTSRRAEARRAFSLQEQMFTLVYAGALAPEKGVDVAIEAVARCATAQLLVTGAGPEEAALRALAARVAPERVVFAAPETGPVSAYAAADAIVLASRGGDSMPAVLIEAGLMELPAIATPIEAIPEIVLPGITGELVPVGDVNALAQVIGRLATDPDRVRALGHAARAHCLEHYSIEPIAAAWERVLREVVRQRQR